MIYEKESDLVYSRCKRSRLWSFLCLSSPRQCEVVRAFRTAPRKDNALATVSASMRVWFNHGSDLVRDMSVYYGGVGAHTLSAENTTRHVIGR